VSGLVGDMFEPVSEGYRSQKSGWPKRFVTGGYQGLIREGFRPRLDFFFLYHRLIPNEAGPINWLSQPI
jgi:hypothetical protein